MPEIKSIKTGVKLSLVLLCVLLFLLLSSTAALAAMMGDVNGDGRINVQDVILVQKHILSPNLTTAQQAVADVNGNGVINVRDAILIMVMHWGEPGKAKSLERWVYLHQVIRVLVMLMQTPGEITKAREG